MSPLKAGRHPANDDENEACCDHKWKAVVDPQLTQYLGVAPQRSPPARKQRSPSPLHEREDELEREQCGRPANCQSAEGMQLVRDEIGLEAREDCPGDLASVPPVRTAAVELLVQ